MTRISSFCISLSAAALLAAALPGPAQSQTLTGLRITDVATGRDFQSTVSPDSENFTINTGLDLFRPTRSSEDTLGRRFIRRLLDVTITSDGSANAPFTDLVVRGNGVYRGRLGNGQRVAGTVSGFGSAAFSNPDAETYVSGTYTEQRGSDTIEISYETDREAGGWRQILRQMLYMESVYESARYGGGTEVLGERDPIITSSAAEHINRGTNITGRNANLLSADLRVYINDEDVVAANPPLSCTGLECSVQATIPSMFDSEMDAFVPGEAAETFPVLSASHFVPTDTGNAGEEGFVAADDKVDVVQSHQGIHLALDRSG
ncbi:MAG: hypothetical protein GDA41_02225, partial [Rhodospirillales bacterium]|nr:hypothetical protein [Rhodospirillales bacterium]